MVPMASSDTTPVARNTESGAFAGNGPVDRCCTAESLLGGRMDMCLGILWRLSPWLSRIDVWAGAGIAEQAGWGENIWPQRTAI